MISKSFAAVVPLVCASMFIPAAALAQTPAQPTAPPLPQSSVQSITVTATRTPVPVVEAIAEVTVIDRAMLDRNQGRTLPELLSRQPGLQMASNGGLGKASSIFIRGLEARHTLLLVDGVRVGSATLGIPSLDNLPLEAVERIEIVRGPMSALYGSGAMGGVIQVFLRKGGSAPAVNTKVAAGSHGHAEASIGGGSGGPVGRGSIDMAAQLQHTTTDGISATNPRVPFGSYNPDRDGFRQAGGSLRIGWQPLVDWRVELLGLDSQGRTAIDDGPDADARADLKTRLAALSVHGRVTTGWRTRFSVSDATDAYDTLATASRFTGLGATVSHTQQYSVENIFATPVGEALALLERTEDRVSRPGAAYSVSDRHVDSIAAGLNGNAGPHSWQGSLRRERNSQFGGLTTGAVGYGYAFSPMWRLGASYGSSGTQPSFNQLYFPGFGNPTLQPEKGRHAELSLRWSLAEHTLRAAYYEHRYRGFISSGPQPANLPRVRIDGVTLAYDGRFRDLDLSASLDHVDPRNDTVGSANFGKRLPRRANDALRVAADRSVGAVSVGATLAAFSSRYDDAANVARLGGHVTADLRVAYRLTQDWTLDARLNNLTGKAYETVLGYNQPGREGFVTLRYRWP